MQTDEKPYPDGFFASILQLFVTRRLLSYQSVIKAFHILQMHLPFPLNLFSEHQSQYMNSLNSLLNFEFARFLSTALS